MTQRKNWQLPLSPLVLQKATLKQQKGKATNKRMRPSKRFRENEIYGSGEWGRSEDGFTFCLKVKQL
jgi:hypothetical protein